MHADRGRGVYFCQCYNWRVKGLKFSRCFHTNKAGMDKILGIRSGMLKSAPRQWPPDAAIRAIMW